jgi:hypothetical protein
MSETLIKILQKLKEIEPDNDLSKRSLPLILSAPQNRRAPLKNFFRAFQFSGALVLASLLLFIVFGGLTKLSQNFFSSNQLTSLDAENIRRELNDLDLKIKLTEVKYISENPLSQTGVALNKTEAEDKSVEDLLKELSL